MLDFSSILGAIQPELSQVNQGLQTALDSDVELIREIGDYLINSGGKRIRPILVLLASKTLGLSGLKPILTANIIELIHTATLLHDDVVDESTLRRGKPCANIAFGNAASVLTGDFLYSRSFELMCQLDNLEVMKVLANASNKIAEGEVQQLQNCHNPHITETTYFDVIYAKTAKLFEAACHVPAVLANASHTTRSALINYGKYLGTAFQIIDDVIDYEADPETSGKNMGDDLAEGKTTLPLIIAMKQGQPDQIKLVQKAIKTGTLENIEAILSILQNTNALQLTRARAVEETKKAKAALDLLPQNKEIQPLRALCDLAIQRKN